MTAVVARYAAAADHDLLGGYIPFCRDLGVSDRALRDRLRAARRFLAVRPDLAAWMRRPVPARLTDLRRTGAWPLIGWAILTGHVTADLELLLVKDFGSHTRWCSASHRCVRRKIPMASQNVGIDLHRRRSVIVRQTPDGEVVDTVRIDNDPVALSCAIAEAGPDTEVVVEATYGVVLGGRRAHRVRRDGASRAPAGGEGVRVPAREERRARRERSGGSVAHGPAARGVDRPAVSAAAARARQIPREAGPRCARG